MSGVPGDFDTKGMTKAKLIELLATLPDDALLHCNRVQNMTAYDAAGNYLGVIDFLTEEFEE